MFKSLKKKSQKLKKNQMNVMMLVVSFLGFILPIYLDQLAKGLNQKLTAINEENREAEKLKQLIKQNQQS